MIWRHHVGRVSRIGPFSDTLEHRDGFQKTYKVGYDHLIYQAGGSLGLKLPPRAESMTMKGWQHWLKKHAKLNAAGLAAPKGGHVLPRTLWPTFSRRRLVAAPSTPHSARMNRYYMEDLKSRRYRGWRQSLPP